MVNNRILICGGTGCHSANSNRLVDKMNELVKENNLDMQVIKTGCFGLCELGPIMIVEPEGSFYSRVEEGFLDEIVKEHLIGGKVVEKYLNPSTITADGIISFEETDFYAKQKRIALRNCGVISAEHIEEYIEHDGYKAIEKVIKTMTPEEVVGEVKKSNLRGRGGGGFPTGLKWEITRTFEDDQKYVLCNADEGDPGAFMDRSILEGDPHTIIEAMAITGYAIGADEGYVYVRAEYPIAVQRLELAINQAREKGFLGKNLFGSNFNFDLFIKQGAGAFVCGEETALISSVEGKRGEPTTKPPFPAESGLWGRSTVINNVETYANIPVIINKGADWFTTMGTEKSKGTKVFALGGKINNTGLIEVPMGITLREVLFEIGGGIPKGKKFKAAQTGGPSGGCLPAELLDTKIDYDSLKEVGSMMGSGGLIVMDEDNCMVDIAKFFLEFTVDESCGKCTACRIGTKRLYETLVKITEGKGTMEDLEDLEKLSETVKSSSLCGLGQTAPNPILSTLRFFRDEYEAHINGSCPAGVCTALLAYSIIPEKCIGCTVCAKNCPVDAIEGQRKSIHIIDKEKCIKCGVCLEKCKFGAVKR
ncbi:MAG: NADH-quinone oxidoreductase subunit NuoF [Lachnospirales bacterium]